MATVAAKKMHKIKDGEPSDFSGLVEVILQLQYRIDENDEYEFCYRQSAQFTASRLSPWARKIEQKPWSPYMKRKEFIASLSLDIGIRGYDTLIQVDTFGPHLSWSLIHDAVTTLDDHSDLYGELRYWNGSSWQRREDFDKKVCTRMRFKAKFNADATAEESHKFSYNVRLRDPKGEMVEYEIDPDIKNPSV